MNSLYRLLFSLFILSVIYFFPKSVLAQQNPNQSDGAIHMVCLTATRDGGHIALLSGTPFYPDKKVEIWRKVYGRFEKAQYNTQEGESDFAVLGATANQVIGNVEGKLVVDSDGSAQTKEAEKRVRVESVTPNSTTHLFYGVQQLNIDVLDAEKTALKLSTFFPPVGGASNCVSVHWDPYGIVFDTVSLEPIPGIEVSLYKNAVAPGNIVPVGPGVSQNPYKVGANGMFNFIVPDGNYYLVPNVPSTYTYPASAAELSKLTTSQTYYSDFYTGGVIVQQGAIEHRDIPLVPKDPTNPSNTAPVVEADLTQYCVGEKCYQMVYGTCSHPGCIVKAYSGGKYIPNTEVTVGTNRQFEMTIDNSLIDQTKPIEIRGEKKPVVTATPTPTSSAIIRATDYLLSLVSKNAEAATNTSSNTITLAPIPTYLEGYAYDEKIQAVPNATVLLVIPSMENRIVAKVKADQNGYIYIPASIVPPTSFELVIADKNGTVLNSVSTSTFIEQNKPYYEELQIDVFQNPDKETDLAKAEEIIKEQERNPITIPFNSLQVGDNLSGERANTAPQTNTDSKNDWKVLAMGALLAVLALGVAITAALKNRRKTSSSI
jgi:hypothetical protein